MVMPKTIGTCADHAYKIQQERLKLQKRVDDMKAQELALLKHAEVMMQKAHLEVCKGKLGQIRRSMEALPQGENWGKIYEHIAETGQFELLQRRISVSACRERWDLGEKIPGIDRIDLIRPRLSKA
jgi:hypothetical protein